MIKSSIGMWRPVVSVVAAVATAACMVPAFSPAVVQAEAAGAAETVIVDVATYSDDAFEVQKEVGESVTFALGRYAKDGYTYEWTHRVEVWDEEEEDYEYSYETVGTDSSLTIESIDSSDEGRYRCSVYDQDEDLVTDVEVNLSVVDGTNDGILFRDTETYQSIRPGQSATFDSTAYSLSGSKLSYQWQKGTSVYDEEEDEWNDVWENISGATSAKFTTPKLSAADFPAEYRCVVTDQKGNYEYQSFTVNKEDALSVTQTSSADIAAEGEKVSFSSSMTNNGATDISYQWYAEDKYGNDILVPGATSASYTATMSEVRPTVSAYEFKSVFVEVKYKDGDETHWASSAYEDSSSVLVYDKSAKTVDLPKANTMQGNSVQIVKKSGASKLALSFAKKDLGYNDVRIYDRNKKFVGYYSGDELSGKHLTVSGDTVYVAFYSILNEYDSGDSIDPSLGYEVTSVSAISDAKAPVYQSIRLAKKTVKVKRGKKATVKVKGAKTKLKVSVPKKVKKTLKVTVKKNKLTIKASKKLKKGKTYKVKVWAVASGSYAKSASKTLKVKIK